MYEVPQHNCLHFEKQLYNIGDAMKPVRSVRAVLVSDGVPYVKLQFLPGDPCSIIGTDIIGRVQSISIVEATVTGTGELAHRVTHEVAWWHGGDRKSHWFTDAELDVPG